MMTDNRTAATMKTTAGDAAVDGLILGIVAGVLMALVLMVMGLIGGTSPTSVLARFDISANPSPLIGGIMHLAVAAVYGMVFGLIWNAIPVRVARVIPIWGGGIVYGIALVVLAETIILPRSNSTLLEIPVVYFGSAHLVYGFALGWLIQHKIRGGD